MDLAEQSNPFPEATQPSAGDDAPVRVLQSDDIFQGGREVRIEHEDSVYRLRLTRKGKLILHK